MSRVYHDLLFPNTYNTKRIRQLFIAFVLDIKRLSLPASKRPITMATSAWAADNGDKVPIQEKV